MTFGKQLDEYMKITGCTAKELARVSGISETTLSRYRNDMRISKITAEQIEALSKGLIVLAEDDNKLSYDDVYSVLTEIANIEIYDFQTIIENVNTLIRNLDITSSELAKSLNYDASYLSRIRSGQRKPVDIKQFVNSISQYIIRKYGDNDFIKSILQSEDLSDGNDHEKIVHWICNGTLEIQESKEDFINNFMTSLNQFDLNEYLNVMHFNETHIPSLPFYIPMNKSYYGIEQMRQGELDFFKSVMFSKKSKDIFMCSDMPITDMAEDTTFDKKWMMAIAVILKKNFHINIIHDIDRPLQELLLGLEAWMPLYMTGQISSYYFKNNSANIYRHLIYIHGNVALIGESISGYPENSKYYLTKNKNEVNYYKKRADNILSKATPLMQIFNKENAEDYKHFLQQDAKTNGTRRNIYSVLPIYTFSKELFYQIGKSNNLSERETSAIWTQIEQLKNYFDTIIEENEIIDEIPDLTQEENNIFVSLAGVFCNQKITYSLEQYKKHLKLTREYVKKHHNYSLQILPQTTFKNIDIIIHEGKWAMISKKTIPAIHFVIKEKRLLNAIENFSVPVIDL